MNVYCVGHLADKFGHEPLQLKVKTPMLMFRGLECCIEGWEDELRKMAASGDKVAVVTSNCRGELRNILPESLTTKFRPDVTDVFVVSSIQGNDPATLAAIGSSIMAAGTAVASTLGVSSFSAFLTKMAVSFAVNLIVGAITQALAPSPDATQSPDENASFIFNGPVNTNTQGTAIPLVYGRCMTGSVTISAGIYVEDMLVQPDGATPVDDPIVVIPNPNNEQGGP